ncbi:MAG TPA: hypothetical protein VMJ11_24080 [Paraburkholderia sp.]|uniref:hypothetical protein n=1 Tax=Paraburkholderia sp. TaxID=1926495 RepID=UPI002BF362DA|nr:hypothetical protein [Paraburkholderia sp.]HTR09677.1 hypothetical protein [Paraburkholderia sp.]
MIQPMPILSILWRSQAQNGAIATNTADVFDAYWHGRPVRIAVRRSAEKTIDSAAHQFAFLRLLMRWPPFQYNP